MVFRKHNPETKKNRSSGNRSNILDICYRLRFFSIALLLLLYFFYGFSIVSLKHFMTFLLFLYSIYGFSVVRLSAVFCYLFTVVFRSGLLLLIQDTDGV